MWLPGGWSLFCAVLKHASFLALPLPSSTYDRIVCGFPFSVKHLTAVKILTLKALNF